MAQKWFTFNQNFKDHELDVIALHREILQRKAFLRKIYADLYREIVLALTSQKRPILELGSGSGFLRDFIDGLITSDVVQCSDIAVVCDGCHLPFLDCSLGAIVMIDVLHHIGEPRLFFREAIRCLRPNGVILMIEPWTTVWSRLVWSKFHHEPFLPEAKQWESAPQCSLGGANSALPWIIFERDKAQFSTEFTQLHIRQIKLGMSFCKILSGGFTLKISMPGWSYNFCRSLENKLSPWMKWLAMSAQIEVVRK